MYATVFYRYLIQQLGWVIQDSLKGMLFEKRYVKFSCYNILLLLDFMVEIIIILIDFLITNNYY